ISGHCDDFRHNRQAPELCADLIKGQVQLRMACDPGGLHAADVSVDLRSSGQIDAAARFKPFQSAHLEPVVLSRFLRAKTAFELDKEFRSGGDRISLSRQASLSLAVGWLGIRRQLVRRRGLPFLWRVTRRRLLRWRLLRSQSESR